MTTATSRAATRRGRRLTGALLLPVALLLAAAAARAPNDSAAAPPPPPRVTTDGGTLEGSVDSATGVLVFRGVPYAAPPVGPLRWRPPLPAARWTGVRPATALAHNCMQTRVYSDIDAFAAGVSEDCLYLNVWTPSTAGATRPVMVWIHGGGFHSGFGGEERHDGARLARKGAVVVTINYRLGPFGFLAHPALAAESPRHASGNYGLLDQISALRWVRRNAARFGGDPSRVTVFGESAGGMSVGALVASPLAAGLFRRAILESGTGVGLGVQRRAAAESLGVRFAAALGVRGRGRAAAAALRALTADSVMAGVALAAKNDSVWRASALPLAPAVDGWVLPHPVDSAIAGGKANVVAAIVGSNRDEPRELFGAPARSFARLLAARGAPVYLYEFARAGEDSASRARGAYHSAEITFVFGRPRPLLESAGHAAYDSTLAEAMSDYWLSFATSGDPNGPPNARRLPRWPRYRPATDAYLELGPEVVAKAGLHRAEYDSLDRVGRGRGEIRP